MKCIQALHVLEHKAEDVWRDSLHPTVVVPMIYNITESPLFASFFGSFFTGPTTTFPFTYFPFPFLFLQGQHTETLSTSTNATIWHPLLPSLTVTFIPDQEGRTLTPRGLIRTLAQRQRG